MATYVEIISRTDELKPNTYSIGQKMRWLNILEQQIKQKVIDTHERHPEESEVVIFSYSENIEEHGDDSLLVPEAYDILYVYHLFAQIDFANSEYERFNNSNAMYEAAYREYANWYNRTHKPLSASNIYY